MVLTSDTYNVVNIYKELVKKYQNTLSLKYDVRV